MNDPRLDWELGSELSDVVDEVMLIVVFVVFVFSPYLYRPRSNVSIHHHCA